ncbi:lysozyme-like domain-containing protein [Crucibulum laeve]|uniref:Lysozyme-like domain-containing protein n=1 Tax=Crucibulum laeve TaxID=68775 RepID=A0A5C3MI92_9AGAR|nr:lysozyme-like domain-containing protein [Crucibulum laeve]
MKIPTAVLAVFCTLLAVNASNPHDNLALSSRHAKLANRAPALERKNVTKRCPKRTTKNNSNNGIVKASSTPSSAPQETPTSIKEKTASTAAPAPAPAATTKAASSVNNAASGTINVKSSCGSIGASKKTSHTAGPNGSIEWLNCGIDSGGWNPPYIRIENVVAQSLSGAINSGSSPFTACKNFVGTFEKYGNQYGIPPIMLASFAMQESSCNPNTVGGGGEQGLMQITKEKCADAPGGNCKDPDFNIRTGAKFFADTLNGNNGDLLLSLGQYNGWYRGLTYAKATAARFTSCCRCQNNLDYLHQFLNGWLQNINAYDSSLRLGKYFNLDTC